MSTEQPQPPPSQQPPQQVWVTMPGAQGNAQHLAYLLEQHGDFKKVRWASTGTIEWLGADAPISFDLGRRRRGTPDYMTPKVLGQVVTEAAAAQTKKKRTSTRSSNNNSNNNKQPPKEPPASSSNANAKNKETAAVERSTSHKGGRRKKSNTMAPAAAAAPTDPEASVTTSRRPREPATTAAASLTPEQQRCVEIARDIQVGMRLAVFWGGDEAYYPGTVTKERLLDPLTGRKSFFMEYDDGEKEWVDFGHGILFKVLKRATTTSSLIDSTATTTSSQTKPKSTTVVSGGAHTISNKKRGRGRPRKRVREDSFDDDDDDGDDDDEDFSIHDSDEDYVDDDDEDHKRKRKITSSNHQQRPKKRTTLDRTRKDRHSKTNHHDERTAPSIQQKQDMNKSDPRADSRKEQPTRKRDPPAGKSVEMLHDHGPRERKSAPTFESDPPVRDNRKKEPPAHFAPPSSSDEKSHKRNHDNNDHAMILHDASSDLRCDSHAKERHNKEKQQESTDARNKAVPSTGSYVKGTPVAKKLEGQNKWVSGTILEFNAGGDCRVQFQNVEERVSIEEIHLMVYDADTTRYPIGTKVKKNSGSPGKSTKGKVISLDGSLYKVRYNDDKQEILGTSDMDKFFKSTRATHDDDSNHDDGNKNNNNAPLVAPSIRDVRLENAVGNDEGNTTEEGSQSAGQSTEPELLSPLKSRLAVPETSSQITTTASSTVLTLTTTESSLIPQKMTTTDLPADKLEPSLPVEPQENSSDVDTEKAGPERHTEDSSIPEATTIDSKSVEKPTLQNVPEDKAENENNSSSRTSTPAVAKLPGTIVVTTHLNNDNSTSAQLEQESHGADSKMPIEALAVEETSTVVKSIAKTEPKEFSTEPATRPDVAETPLAPTEQHDTSQTPQDEKSGSTVDPSSDDKAKTSVLEHVEISEGDPVDKNHTKCFNSDVRESLLLQDKAEIPPTVFAPEKMTVPEITAVDDAEKLNDSKNKVESPKLGELPDVQKASLSETTASTVMTPPDEKSITTHVNAPEEKEGSSAVDETQTDKACADKDAVPSDIEESRKQPDSEPSVENIENVAEKPEGPADLDSAGSCTDKHNTLAVSESGNADKDVAVNKSGIADNDVAVNESGTADKREPVNDSGSTDKGKSNVNNAAVVDDNDGALKPLSSPTTQEPGKEGSVKPTAMEEVPEIPTPVVDSRSDDYLKEKEKPKVVNDGAVTHTVAGAVQRLAYTAAPSVQQRIGNIQHRRPSDVPARKFTNAYDTTTARKIAALRDLHATNSTKQSRKGSPLLKGQPQAKKRRIEETNGGQSSSLTAAAALKRKSLGFGTSHRQDAAPRSSGGPQPPHSTGNKHNFGSLRPLPIHRGGERGGNISASANLSTRTANAAAAKVAKAHWDAKLADARGPSVQMRQHPTVTGPRGNPSQGPPRPFPWNMPPNLGVQQGPGVSNFASFASSSSTSRGNGVAAPKQNDPPSRKGGVFDDSVEGSNTPARQIAQAPPNAGFRPPMFINNPNPPAFFAFLTPGPQAAFGAAPVGLPGFHGAGNVPVNPQMAIPFRPPPNHFGMHGRGGHGGRGPSLGGNQPARLMPGGPRSINPLPQSANPSPDYLALSIERNRQQRRPANPDPPGFAGDTKSNAKR